MQVLRDEEVQATATRPLAVQLTQLIVRQDFHPKKLKPKKGGELPR